MQGQPVYLVDPGINGVVTNAPTVRSDEIQRAESDFDELYHQRHFESGTAVGLGFARRDDRDRFGTRRNSVARVRRRIYLPIAISAPIFVGGIVRHFVDVYLRRKLAAIKI
jgi:hypothetical protein